MVVVPPKAAAMVPDSKSSAEVVPPNGMSMWVWTSMPPGRTNLPLASMTLSAGMVSADADRRDLFAVDEDVADVLISRGDDRAVFDQDAHVRQLYRFAKSGSGREN